MKKLSDLWSKAFAFQNEVEESIKTKVDDAIKDLPVDANNTNNSIQRRLETIFTTWELSDRLNATM